MQYLTKGWPECQRLDKESESKKYKAHTHKKGQVMWVDNMKPEHQESLESDDMPALAGTPRSPTFVSGVISRILSEYE